MDGDSRLLSKIEISKTFRNMTTVWVWLRGFRFEYVINEEQVENFEKKYQDLLENVKINFIFVKCHR